VKGRAVGIAGEEQEIVRRIGHQKIGYAIAIEIVDRERGGDGAEVRVRSGSEGAIAVAEENERKLAYAIRSDEIDDAIWSTGVGRRSAHIGENGNRNVVADPTRQRVRRRPAKYLVLRQSELRRKHDDSANGQYSYGRFPSIHHTTPALSE